MKNDKISEALVALFLRLNGFFTAGLIIHTNSNARMGGEIDCLAVRFPHRDQTGFSIEDSAHLNPSGKYIDLLICEVKSTNPSFNESMQQPEYLNQALSWAGVIPSGKLDAAVSTLVAMFESKDFVKLSKEGYTCDNVRIRAMLACPSCDSLSAPEGTLTGPIIMEYLFDSLHPSKRPETCGRRYDYEQWGILFSQIVRWFKNLKSDSQPKFSELCDHLRQNRQQNND